MGGGAGSCVWVESAGRRFFVFAKRARPCLVAPPAPSPAPARVPTLQTRALTSGLLTPASPRRRGRRGRPQSRLPKTAACEPLSQLPLTTVAPPFRRRCLSRPSSLSSSARAARDQAVAFSRLTWRRGPAGALSPSRASRSRLAAMRASRSASYALAEEDGMGCVWWGGACVAGAAQRRLRVLSFCYWFFAAAARRLRTKKNQHFGGVHRQSRPPSLRSFRLPAHS